MSRCLLVIACCCSTGGWALAADAQAPLRDRIDAAIEAPLDGQFAPLADDAEFIRRVYLDVTGRLPSSVEVRAFVADSSPAKRERLIDQLLTSPGYARRMQTVFDVALMQRRGQKHIPLAEWREYLRKSFDENKPYDLLAREILGSDGVDPKVRPAVRFYLDRDGEPNLLTRDVGRLFLGRDMQCAQCHDHPLINAYKQEHYYGLFAFVSRGFVYTDPKQKQTFFAEKGEGDVAFMSVFDKNKTNRNTGPKLMEAAALAEPKFDKGHEYLVAPAKDVRPVPKYSRRAQLAATATSGGSPDFNRNIVNRLWAQFMGRGIVEPVDFHHPDNPPSHPELLELLAQEFVAMKFDMRAFVRELLLSRTYQRASTVPESFPADAAAPQKFAVAALKPLSPEQLAWSLMDALGVSDGPRANEQARMQGDPRLMDIFRADAKRARLQEEYLERAVYTALDANVAQFVSLYGGSPGEGDIGFQPTVQQALFVANGPAVRGWLANGAPLTARLAAIPDLPKLVEELYLSVLSRLPSEQERIDGVEHFIRGGESREALVQQLAWGLLASAEFRFNH